MASEKLVSLQDEVTCPICLELLTEPLSLDCGHSFCQICITANSNESLTGQERARKCPVCRINYKSGKLRPNWHLANIVQRVREVKLSLEEQEKHLCAHHGEKLQKVSRGLSRVEAGNPGFPRLVQGTSGGFSWWL